jgi:signal transduction histidine kinase
MNILLPLLIITPIMLLLALGLIVFVVLYQKRLIQHQEQVWQLEASKQYQVLEATMQAQEEERRRVARDLHDEVGSMLSLVKLNLYQLTGSIKGESDEVCGAEANIKKLLDEVIGSVRRISHDLMPVVLDKMGHCGAPCLPPPELRCFWSATTRAEGSLQSRSSFCTAWCRNC